jgi:DNA-binding NarL/FixJ family response regulator
MINTVIVEDNQFMQNHLVNMLSAESDFNIAGVFKDAFDAEKACDTQQIDLVLMDVQTLHNHSGLAAGERIRKNNGAKVVIVTSLIDSEVLEKAKAGAADSLWYKDHGDDELVDIIRRTVSGEQVFSDTPPSVELNEMFSSEISPRQMQILRRFVQGMTYDEIAQELNLSKNGVRWNLDQIVEKGGFKNKHELLAALIENKLIVTTLKDE